MLNICPVVYVEGSGAFKPRFVPVRRDCNTLSALYSRVMHIEEAETLGDVFDRLEVVDNYNCDRDALVIWTQRQTNFYCGGKVELSVGYARQSVTRHTTYQHQVVHISRQNDGTLRTAISA